MKIITTLLERVEFRSARLDDRFGNKLRKRSRREYSYTNDIENKYSNIISNILSLRIFQLDSITSILFVFFIVNKKLRVDSTNLQNMSFPQL